MVHSVSEVNHFIKGLLDHQGLLQNMAVRGEVSNFKRYPSGHCYFSIKDDKSSLKCVMFRNNAARLLFEPQNGMQVVVTGSISVYERDGVYQLYAETMMPEGKGSLAAAFEQLKEKLKNEGLFDESRKKPLVKFPQKIGVVTSRAGAVLHDIYRVVKRREPSVQLILYPVQVQGDMASKEISEGIRFFNNEYPVDVLIVGRGGGSMEDLWAFNVEEVVRAVADSEIPVISAVGHEVDFTIADFVADLRAPTPTGAAEMAVPNLSDVIDMISSYKIRLNEAITKSYKLKELYLDKIKNSYIIKNPLQLTLTKKQNIMILEDKLNTLIKQIYKLNEIKLSHIIEKLELISPLNVLKRGYSLTYKDDVIVKCKDISKDDNIKIKFDEGIINTKVVSKEKL